MKSSVSARLNAGLLDQKYEQWCDDPLTVEGNWSSFFEGFELGSAQVKEKGGVSTAKSGATSVPAENLSSDEHNLNFRGKCVSLVYNYRTLGHTQAQINPLNGEAPRNPRLELSQFGLTEADLQREASTQFFRAGQKMKLGEMIQGLEECYSSKIGFEFMHIHNTVVRNWIRRKIEHRFEERYAQDHSQEKILGWILESELFESFIGKKFLGEKRFSLEGGEGLMVLLNTILEKCPVSSVKEIELGMAHRGRLNLWVNILG